VLGRALLEGLTHVHADVLHLLGVAPVGTQVAAEDLEDVALAAARRQLHLRADDSYT
jgi:hypothetical protein